VAEATERPSRLDAAVLERVAASRAPVFCCLNKIDLVTPKSRLLPLIDAYRARHPFAEIVPVSAERGDNCDTLLELAVRALPERPPYFPRESLTDQPETFYVAEMIREKLFRLTHEEVPYACAVRVEELTERERPECLYIRATIFVEHESQKGIVIGKGGAMLKAIGSAARREIEAFLGAKVFLGLFVKVRQDWRENPRALDEVGLDRGGRDT
jgi:GTP-binding protein Era